MPEKTSQDTAASMQQNWDNPRRFAGLTFAAKSKLKPFPLGRNMTNSSRTTFMNCRRKYQYSYVLGLAPRRPSIPFLVGGLFHDAMDRIYTAKGKYDLDQEKLIAEKACEKSSESPGLTPEESDKIWVQSSIVFGMISGYVKQWLPQDLKNWDVLEAESAFDIPIKLPDGTVFQYRGKTDLIVRHKKTKKVKLVEHKTTSRLDAGYVSKLPLDNQIIGYVWAKNKEKLGITEVVYNVVKKPGIRLKQNESLEQFRKRLVEEYLINTSNYFYRETLTFDPRDIDRFYEELTRFLGEVDRCEKEQYYYQNTTQCTAMGVCPFMKLCLDGINDDTLGLYRIKDRAHEELPAEEAD